MYERLVFSGNALIAITVFTLTHIWRLPLGPSVNYAYDIKENSYFFIMYAYIHIVYIDIYHYFGILLCQTFNSWVVFEVGLNTSYSHLPYITLTRRVCITIYALIYCMSALTSCIYNKCIIYYRGCKHYIYIYIWGNIHYMNLSSYIGIRKSLAVGHNMSIENTHAWEKLCDQRNMVQICRNPIC